MFKRVEFRSMGARRNAHISKRHVSALIEGELRDTTTVHFAGGWLVVDGALADVARRLGIKIRGKK